LILKGLSIKPGQSVQINASWEFEVPAGNFTYVWEQHRICFIAYWYPQIAVYDDIDGWDMIQYTEIQSFTMTSMTMTSNNRSK
jgi:hypothetical protein